MKRLSELSVLCLFVFLSLTSVAEASDLTDYSNGKTTQKIISIRDSFNAAIAEHDAERIAGYIDDQYQITTSDGGQYQSTPVEEAAAWREIFRDNPDIVYIRTPNVVDVNSFLDLAAETGSWVGRWSSADGDVEVGGSYFAQWRKVGESWKIRAEVFVGLYCNGHGC